MIDRYSSSDTNSQSTLPPVSGPRTERPWRNAAASPNTSTSIEPTMTIRSNGPAAAASVRIAGRSVARCAAPSTIHRPIRPAANRIPISAWMTTTTSVPVIPVVSPGSGLLDALHRDRDVTDLGPDLTVNLAGDVRVALQEVLGRLATLAQPRLAEREPCAGLGDDVERDTDVEKAALARDALAV